jgi:O-antigen ligase
MINKGLAIFHEKISASQRNLFICFALIFTIAWFISLVENQWLWLLLIPVSLIIWFSIIDFKIIFFLLLFFIPLSTEITFDNGLGTDLPTEPLIIGLMGIGLLYFLIHFKKMGRNFLTHPITLLIYLHLFWTFFTSLTSYSILISLKFLLAKIWYVCTFYFMAGYLLRTEKRIKRMFWVVLLPMILSVIVIWYRHSSYGFSFGDIHRVLHPFQRNHVNYAALLALLFPWIFLLRFEYSKGSFVRLFLTMLLPIWLIAIYLSFTRAAYGAILISAVAGLLLWWRSLIPFVYAGIIVVVIGIFWLTNNNKYLAFAPNYDRTISHTEFDNLLEATVKLEDISTMERLYRWVAGAHMSVKEPVVGFGPGSFVQHYKAYTVKGFRTYVSNNEEKSGIHSYFLMVLVEQGFPGLIIFSLLILAILKSGQRVINDPRSRHRPWIPMATITSFIVILTFLTINDLVETDKIGSFFFMFIAILVNTDIHFWDKK